jgi:hypothetical protein
VTSRNEAKKGELLLPLSALKSRVHLNVSSSSCACLSTEANPSVSRMDTLNASACPRPLYHRTQDKYVRPGPLFPPAPPCSRGTGSKVVHFTCMTPSRKRGPFACTVTVTVLHSGAEIATNHPSPLRRDPTRLRPSSLPHSPRSRQARCGRMADLTPGSRPPRPCFPPSL